MDTHRVSKVGAALRAPRSSLTRSPELLGVSERPRAVLQARAHDAASPGRNFHCVPGRIPIDRARLLCRSQASVPRNEDIPSALEGAARFGAGRGAQYARREVV